jgi:START domain
MKTYLVLFSSLLILSFSIPSNPPCGEWELKAEEGSFKVYVRQCDNSPIKELKVVDKFKGDFAKLAKEVAHISFTTKVSASCTEAKIVKPIDAQTSIQYYYFKMPIGISDRDIVLKNTTIVKGNKLRSTSEVYPTAEVPEKKGVIRLVKSRSAYEFEKLSDGNITMLYTAFTDPNGSLPAWIVNWVATNETKKMSAKIKELVK